MGQALSVGDSWKCDVWKMTLEFSDTGIGPGYECFIRLCLEEVFVVEELVWVRMIGNGCMRSEFNYSILRWAHKKSDVLSGISVYQDGSEVLM